MSGDLFRNEKATVIRLNDNDFKIENGKAYVVHQEFKGNDGYIMAFASFCPHCRAKEDFWSYLGQQFNHNSQYKKEHFKIAIIDSDDPDVGKILSFLEVGPIPRFLNVSHNSKNGMGEISNYEGEMTIEGFLKVACEKSSANKAPICQIDSKKFNAPEFNYN